MIQLNKVPILLLLVCLFSACEKQSKTPSYNDQPVIEGYLYANNSPSIKIMRQVASSKNVVFSDNNIDSLDVTIITQDSVYFLIPTGNGTYVNTNLIIKEGAEYTLQFMYNNRVVSAVTTVPNIPEDYKQSVTEISIQKIDANTTFTPGSFQMNDPIDLDWDNADNSHYMVIVENMETSPTLIRDTTDSRFQTRSFRNEPAIINSYSMRDQQFQYFGSHRLTLYRLNPDYATLYNDNSNSSQNLTNPTTNISNGLGIFTGISTDTLYLQVNKKK
jgi:hypothetical protein